MQIELNEVEAIYRKELQNLMEHENPISAKSILEISVSLFKSVKIIDISNLDDDNDILFCQYGVYNQGETFGKCFFNITRQFTKPEEDEPYQLCIDLCYDPEPFMNFGICTAWHDEFSDLDDFITHIKLTEGFKSMIGLIPKKVQLEFYQC